MGGNKHKNGIVCMFPGCEKTMRTQKFKLHFTKQHLKAGEVYSVEHRRRFEVARDEEYASDSPAPQKLESLPLQQQQQQQLSMAAQISPPTYQQVAAAAASLAPPTVDAAVATTGLMPAFTPVASTVVADASTSLENETGTAAADGTAMKVVQTDDVAHSDALLSSDAGAEDAQQQRASRPNPNVHQPRSSDGRFGYTPPTISSISSSLMASPSGTKRPVSALEPANQMQVDPSRAVLVQYIETMDQRFHELIQKMSQVIDGQRELIDMLRRPPSAETALLLEHTPSLAATTQSQSGSPSADGSAKKRRKSNGGAEQSAQSQANGAAHQRSSSSSSSSSSVAPSSSALL